jgi:hypothetical protein
MDAEKINRIALTILRHAFQNSSIPPLIVSAAPIFHGRLSHLHLA